MSVLRRVFTGALILVFTSSLVSGQRPRSADAQSLAEVPGSLGGQSQVIDKDLRLLSGKTATVYSDGRAVIYDRNGAIEEERRVRLQPDALNPSQLDKKRLVFDLSRPKLEMFAPSEVVVVFREGITGTKDTFSLPSSELLALRKRKDQNALTTATVPSYTSDGVTNEELAALGVDRSERLFQGFARSRLSSMFEQAQAVSPQERLLDFSNAYRLHITDASVHQAVVALQKLSIATYVSPNWIVSPLDVDAVPLGAKAIAQSRTTAEAFASHREITDVSQNDIPTNYAVSASAQSLLNGPGIDSVAAYDEIERHFHQLPGEGEIITNVSTGDLDGVDVVNSPNDPCYDYVQAYGPTTVLRGRQRYINWPSMPLVPTYTADDSGNLDGAGEVCGVDPFLGEVGLDLSMMAPLPHQLQRAGEVGTGYTDLLGIAPGAKYRLVVPKNATTAITDIQGAFLGAAMQTPRPNVITASLGYGFDLYGLPSRYLEDDSLTRSIITSITHTDGILVCISSGDGIRSKNNPFVEIGPSGGSAATNVVAPGGTPTNLDGIEISSIPSQDYDSGAIDVGGTTLDDVLAQPYESGFSGHTQQVYPETRWDGVTRFSSGYGSRVNVSAPSDNTLAFEHYVGQIPPAPLVSEDSVAVVLEGGTSASAPETAAAAAVVQQVGRLTNHPFAGATVLRAFLEQTGTNVSNLPQADQQLHVGPQVDVRRAVETLFDQANIRDTPAARRIAIAQRREFSETSCAVGVCFDVGSWGNDFVTDTDPGLINLQGSGFPWWVGQQPPPDNSDYNAYEGWITIAPDWEFVPSNAKYQLFAGNRPRSIIATTPSTRLLPKEILEAAGLSLVSKSIRTVKLTYRAVVGSRVVAQNSFSLTFGPADATSNFIPPPQVSAVATGTTIPVSYDLSDLRGASNPYITISYPGAHHMWGPSADGNEAEGWLPSLPSAYPAANNFAYSVALPNLKGTVNIPVSALQGGGIYSVQLYSGNYTVPWCSCGNAVGIGYPAFVRVQPSASAQSAAAPLLSLDGSRPVTSLEIPYGSSFQVSYNVRNVPNATGAMLEISAPGPASVASAGNEYNTFENPNGTIRDNNGFDTGSVSFLRLSGTSGTVRLSAKSARLDPGDWHLIRIMPMNGQTAAGEASDFGSIQEEGIIPADGGGASSVAVNGNGSDGLLTSMRYDAGGDILSSIDAFDQKTGAITRTVASASKSVFALSNWQLFQNCTFICPGFIGAAGGIFTNDVALYESLPSGPAPNSFYTLDPATTGTPKAWKPPFLTSTFRIFAAAPNQSTSTVAFLACDSPQPCGVDPLDPFYVFTWNSAQNTFGSLYNVSGPLYAYSPEYLIPSSGANDIGIDTSTNTAVLKGGDDNGGDFLTVNLTNGVVALFPKSLDFDFGGVTVDSHTHVAFANFLSTDYAFSLLADSLSPLPPHGPFGSGFIAVDEKHGLLLSTEEYGPDYRTNNNAMPGVFVRGEQGQQPQNVEWSPYPGAVSIDDSTRTGYVVDLSLEQVIPFSY